MSDKITPIATSEFLVGKGVRSVQAVVEELIKNADEEITIAAYTIGSGFSEFFELIEKSASRGVKIKILVNKLSEHPHNIVNFLRRLQKTYPHVHVYNFIGKNDGDLHMKVLVTDRMKAVIGSANMTWKGMVENNELGLLIEGETPEKLALLIETVMHNSQRLT